MAQIKIDDIEYNIDDFNDSAKEQYRSLQFVQSEINRLEGTLAIHKTASLAYSRALKEILES